MLDVDYDRVAAVYSCTNLTILNLDFLSSFIPLPFSPSIYFKFELGWIWTREINVNQSVVSRKKSEHLIHISLGEVA